MTPSKPLSFNDWMKTNTYYTNQSAISEKYARYCMNFKSKESCQQKNNF